MSGLFARFNEVLARRMTLVFGTMWMFYIFLAYGLLPLVFPGQTVTLLYWSNVVQMIALPLLMVGTNILGRSSEARATETHDAVMTELSAQRDQGDQLAELVEALHAKHADVATELRVATEEREQLLRGMENIHQETAAVHEIVSAPAAAPAPVAPPSGSTLGGGTNGG